MSLVCALVVLAALSWLIAGVWLGERLLPKFGRPLRDARALSLWLQEWQLGFAQGRPLSQMGEVPQFKFFGRLATTALAHARSYGSFPREILWEWREGLNKEMQFEKRWQGVKHAGLAQFGLFALITWVFITLTADTINEPLAEGVLFTVVVLQVAGALIYWPAMLILAHKRLGGFQVLMESLYCLRSLGGAGLPAQQVVQLSRMDLVAEINTSSLKLLCERVKDVVRLYQQQGLPIVKETQLLLHESWFLREDALAQVVKLADHVRLGVLIVFFGGAYFVFLLGLIHQLLSRG